MSKFQANSASNTQKICEILSQASIKQPRPQHRRPCQCTATRTLPKESTEGTCLVHRPHCRRTEAEPPHPKGQTQDFRTCRCMTTGRRPRPSPPSRPPPPPPHRQHLRNIALMAQPARSHASRRTAARPRGIAWGQRATHSTSILKT